MEHLTLDNTENYTQDQIDEMNQEINQQIDELELTEDFDADQIQQIKECTITDFDTELTIIKTRTLKRDKINFFVRSLPDRCNGTIYIKTVVRF